MLKSPSIVLCSYGKAHCFPSPQHSLFLPNVNPQSSVDQRSDDFWSNDLLHSKRYYATVREDKPKIEEIQWPRMASRTAVPTPYQIFQQKKTDPYSKRRFYELVKQYHPDRHSHDNHGLGQPPLPQAIMIDRYRLVVAANDILSHPAKRKSYDECGAGWDGRPEARFRRDQWSYDSDGRWTGFEDNNTSPFRNATWEDWEKWYQRNDRRKRQPREPVYFSNGGFLSLIAVLACLGGIGQATRMGDHSVSYLKKLESTHADCSQDAQRRKEQAQGYGNLDKRVESFLKTREQAGIPTPLQDNPRRLLPPPDPH